jgi:large subunit ribosomal protein L22
MEIKASLRHLRMAPRKVRLVIDTIRGLDVQEAATRLAFIKKDAARPVLKLLQSAIANAEHNFKLERGKLFVKTITADAGATLKRSMPRAMGRATPIRKRSTHINIVLSDEKKAEVRSKKQEARSTRQEARSKKQEAGSRTLERSTTT